MKTHLPVLRPSANNRSWARLKSARWTRGTLSRFDAGLITTAHDHGSSGDLATGAGRIGYTRNSMLRVRGHPTNIWQAWTAVF
jgi:hypothetical protein